MRASSLGMSVPSRRAVPAPTDAQPAQVAGMSARCDVGYALRPIVLGSVDGLVTSFVVVAGGFAGDVSKRATLAIGASSLVADAFSMGTSEYLSSRTETTFGKALVFGVACFLSFIVFGMIPLVTFASTTDSNIAPTIVSFVASLVVVAVMRAYVTQSWASIVEIVLLGSVAGAIAFLVAYLT